MFLFVSFQGFLALKSHKHAIVYTARGPVVYLPLREKRSRRFS